MSTWNTKSPHENEFWLKFYVLYSISTHVILESYGRGSNWWEITVGAEKNTGQADIPALHHHRGQCKIEIPCTGGEEINKFNKLWRTHKMCQKGSGEVSFLLEVDAIWPLKWFAIFRNWREILQSLMFRCST